MTIDVTYTSPTYNSYVTLVEANALVASLASVIGSDYGYSALSDGVKTDLIYAAAKAVRNVTWLGTLVSTVIASTTMRWPRQNLNYDMNTPVPTDSIPQEVKNFCAAWIVYQLRNNTMGNAAPLKSKTVDKVTTVYATSSRVKRPAVMNALGEIPQDWYTGVQMLGSTNADIVRKF